MSPKNLTCEIDDVKFKTRKSQLEPLRGIHFFLSAVSMYIVFQHNFFKFSVLFNHAKFEPQRLDEVKVGLFSDSLSDKDYVAVCKSGIISYMGNTANETKSGTAYIALRNKITNKVPV